MDWIQGKLIAFALAAIPIGTIAFLVMQQFKRLSYKVDELSPGLKRGAVALIALILTTIGAAAGVPVICEPDVNCLTSLDQSTIEALLKVGLATVTALVIHKGKN